jgi:L-serine dehydratase
MFASALDLYRIGPGPSSAHTVGPLRAARRFVHALEADGVFLQTSRVHIDLYGSVALTGREQSADRAIVAGLAGDSPDATDAATLAARFARVRADGVLPLGRVSPIPFDPATDLVFHVDKAFAYHSNAIRFTARSARGEALAARLYYSTGDGEILTEGEAPDARASLRVPYMFDTGAQALSLGATHGKRLADLVRVNENALRSPGELRLGLTKAAAAMRAAIERGIAAEGTLPASGRMRRAPTQAAALSGADPRLPAWAAVYATAVAEENAAGGRVVAAPSNGAAGPVAALWYQWRTTTPLATDDDTVTYLLAAAAIWNLCRQAGVRHAGCQGEVGVAAAMAAAGLVAVGAGTNAQVLYAAERALEPHLGLACDPAGGLVQDPCIGRNAAAAAIAVNAARTALRLPEAPGHALDSRLAAMAEAGRALTGRYKESSLGGIALNVVDC